MTVVFWTCVAIIAYVYVGYPAMLRAVGAAVWAASAYAADSALEPDISIVIAARNEGARLAARIDNLLALDYPAAAGRSSSSPTARPTTRCEVVARYAGVVDVVSLPPSGKALALNAGIGARARKHRRLRRRAPGVRDRCAARARRAVCGPARSAR